MAADEKRLPQVFFRTVSGRLAISHHSGGRNPFRYELHYNSGNDEVKGVGHSVITDYVNV